jgi:sporulation protein YlmC with PRC-barrel domain
MMHDGRALSRVNVVPTSPQWGCNPLAREEFGRFDGPEAMIHGFPKRELERQVCHMRTTMTTTPLVSLKSGRIDLMNTSEDILGRKVVDRNVDDVGKVDDVFVDLNQRRARFLAVKTGDVLGLGGKTVLVPVDAIASTDSDKVVINQTRDRIVNGPEFDTTRITGETAGSFDASEFPLVDVYQYYAVDEPFWSPTYRDRNWA